MEILAHVARIGFTYGALLLVARLCSKQFVSVSSTFDFILILVLANLVDNVVLGKAPIAQFVAAAASLATMEMLLAVLAYNSRSFKKLMDGKAVTLLAEGKPKIAALRRHFISLSELEALLRLQGIDRDRWNHIKSAFLEITGDVSALKRDEFQTVRKSEKNLLDSGPIK